MFKILNKNNLIALLAIFFVLIFTNGSFFILCDDTNFLVNSIRYVGDAAYESLIYTFWIGGAYALANTGYNAEYIVPLIISKIFVVSWADRINGILCGFQPGGLQQYLTTAKNSYSPLYKDAALWGYNYGALPFYNNVYSPLLAFTGLKPVEKIVYRDNNFYHYTDQPRNVIQYVAALPESDIVNITDSLNGIARQNSAQNELIISTYQTVARSFDRFLQRSGQSLVPVNFLRAYLNNEYLRLNLRLMSISGELVESNDKLVDIDSRLLNYYQALNIQLVQMNSSEFLQIEGICDPRQFRNFQFEDYYECKLAISMGELNSIEGIDALFTYLRTQPNKLLSLDINDDFIYIEGYRGGISLTYQDVLANVQSQIDQAATQITSSTVALTALCASVTGIVTHFHEVSTILSQYNDLSTINIFLSNPDLALSLVQTLQSKGQVVPEFLQQYSNQSAALPDPQDYLLPGESILSPESSIGSPIDNVPSKSNYLLKFGAIMLTGIFIAGSYYLYKNGFDTTPIVETAKTFKETLQDKYVSGLKK